MRNIRQVVLADKREEGNPVLYLERNFFVMITYQKGFHEQVYTSKMGV